MARVPDLGMRKFLTTNLERAAPDAWRWQINLPVLTAALPDLERNPLGPADRYAGPVFVITGGRSPYVQPSDWTAFTGHFPAAEWKVIPESGHNPHMETRAAFVRAVLS
jgi:esterase